MNSIIRSANIKSLSRRAPVTRVNRPVATQMTTLNRRMVLATPFGTRGVKTEADVEAEILADPTKDAHLHGLYLRVGLLLDYLNIKEGKDEEEFLKNYTISPGHPTLEWVFPSPPPEHLFEEPALVKDPDHEHDGHSVAQNKHH
ncbi:hypothetical protein PROFUN_02392 [Planoprotostelium fungivorum]|uniref:Uncharacterized protein n=1 Tax=Planoprotostelium fungivorum TaxID=1890364 RepID=A0A2P6NUP6_9EUKA|nr:hypothetical protein PROFUN_02392 [Planoprotostelium fungivorum]